MGFVIDASMILAWLLPDEGDKHSDALLERWVNGEPIIAPELLRYEVGNAIVMATVRRQRLTEEEMRTKLDEFDALTIQFDEDSRKQLTMATTALAVKHGLSVYDAAYLELAIRKQQPLATLDKRLKQAAKKEKLPTVS